MGKERTPGVRQLMEQVLVGQTTLCGKVDGLRKDFSDFKVQEAATNATQSADIATLKLGVKGAFGKIEKHEGTHPKFFMWIIGSVFTIVSLVMGTAALMTRWGAHHAARAAGLDG